MKLKIKTSAIAKLHDLENLISKHSFSNSAFFDNFHLQTLIDEVEALNPKSESPLIYTLYSMKNLLSIEGEVITAGSEFLKSYVSPYSATVYKLLKQAGCINAFNANLDEFGTGGTGFESFLGPVCNPLDNERMIYGSSSGSAYVVATDLVEFSIGSDTGDSGRCPASAVHIYGFKPSYGAVSRHGVFPFCSQMDTVAILSKSLETIANVLEVISQTDPKDLTTLKTVSKPYGKLFNQPLEKPVKIAVLKDTFANLYKNEKPNSFVHAEFQKTIEKLSKDPNLIIETVSFDPKLLHLLTLIYIIVAYVENISNYSNLNGLLFPFNTDKTGKSTPKHPAQAKNFKDLMKISRSLLGRELKFRQTFGMYCIQGSNYEEIYLRSKKLLTVVNQKIDEIFFKYQAIISPTASDVPEKIKDYKKKYEANNISNILLLANFCGLPAISMPWVKQGDLPVGLHLMCAHKEDELLLKLTNYIAQII